MEQDRALTATREAAVAAAVPDAVMIDRDLHKEDIAFNTIAMALLRFAPEVTYADDFCVLMTLLPV
ncbi:hypothetical protein H8L32_21465 [Undibacterium sp. CY18W]|uniref:Uncharacterized protein n=1 Tax=Undibacterium hunanense TaxID=2762292 RepID=A0ABR6ZVY7_9BURK|nr:hypothetical protein [Undibacterium hunanense]MBC3920051.1 hypothetical protein [Undibacterium hunanense]